MLLENTENQWVVPACGVYMGNKEDNGDAFVCFFRILESRLQRFHPFYFVDSGRFVWLPLLPVVNMWKQIFSASH